MTELIEKILAWLGGAAGFVALIVFLIKFYGGEKQNLYGKTMLDLISTIKTALETNQELQRLVDEAEERLRGVMLREQRDKEVVVAALEKKLRNGEAKHYEHERAQDIEIAGQAQTIIEDIVKIRRISDNLAGVIQEAKRQAEIHHKETEQLQKAMDKTMACMLQNQHRVSELGGEPIELK